MPWGFAMICAFAGAPATALEPATASASRGSVRLRTYATGIPANGDFAPAFERALADLCRGTGSCGGVIEVPAGTFRVSRTIVVPPGVRIVGTGAASVLVLTANQCTGTRPPSALLRFEGSREGAQWQGVEHLWLTTANSAELYPCFSSARDASPRYLPYDTTKATDAPGSYNGCYVEASGEPRFDGSRINAVGIDVEGKGGAGITVTDVRTCGFGTGMVVSDAASGYAETFMSSLNHTGLLLRGSRSWTFENLQVANNEVGLSLQAAGGPNVNIQILGGLVQASSVEGVRAAACESCLFDGTHFEANASGTAGADVHVDGSGSVRHLRIARSSFSGFPHIEIDNPAHGDMCSVDYVSIGDVFGSGFPPNLDIRSACPIHLDTGESGTALLQTSFGRRSRDPAAPSQVLDVSTQSADGTDRPLWGLGVDGEVSIGTYPGNAGLTLGASDPSVSARLLDLVGTSDASERSVALRSSAGTAADAARVRASSFATTEGGTVSLELIPGGTSARSALVVDSRGYVGVNTASPSARLDVKGDVRVAPEGSLHVAAAQPVPSGALLPCDAAHRGVIASRGADPLICLLQDGSWRWMALRGR
jgi:hypothetical protein